MKRKMFDCRPWPGDCTVVISGERDEVVELQALHAVHAHGQRDTPELRSMIRAALTDGGLSEVSANLNELELHTGTIEGDPGVEAHFAFPMFWATGNTSTAVLCVELEPGKSGPRHIDMPEEILLVERGLVEIEVGDERSEFGPGELVLVPAMVPHAFRNVGDDRARIVGFFPSNTVVAIADEIVQPVGGRVIGSPPPELAGAL